MKDKYIDKILLVKLPNVQRPRYRWVVGKGENGRYIVRAPKVGVLLRDLELRREKDFGNDTLLSPEAIIDPYNFADRRRSRTRRIQKIRRTYTYKGGLNGKKCE